MGVKISELPNNSLPYTGSEEIPLIQSGETRAGTLSSFVNYLSGELLADSELAALSGNWQSTYTTVDANSANWQSAYTSYSTNSATFVTYTGATQDVDLGSNDLTTTGYISSNTAFADSLTANNFTALSASINVINITEYELSGFSVSGDVVIDGNVSVTGNVDGRDVSSDGIKLDSVYANANTLSANWQSSYDNQNALSANWQSTYTTVDANSSNWDYQGNDIKALSGNWENTYTDFSANSGNYALKDTDNNFTSIQTFGTNIAVSGSAGITGNLTLNTEPTVDKHASTKKYVDDQVAVDATTTVKGRVELATDAEAHAATDTTRAITPSNLLIKKDVTAFVAGNLTGNSRGLNALDVQSSRTAATQVAGGTNSVAVGLRNTVSAGGAIGIGYSNTASGYAATAVGNGNIASGFSRSSASGYINTASGDQSSAFGYINIASGFNSSAFGRNNTASNYNTSAFGYINIASGFNSSAFGRTNTASGYQSSAIGYSNTAIGTHSSLVGSSNREINGGTATFTKNSLFGYDNEVSSSGSGVSIQNLTVVGYKNSWTQNTGLSGATVVGYQNLPQGSYSVLVGASNRESGTATYSKNSLFGYDNKILSSGSGVSIQNCTIVGYQNTWTQSSSLNGATAVGYSNEASSTYTSAIGYGNTASGNYGSSAFGYSNTASANYGSFAFGGGNTASGVAGKAFGSFNTASGVASNAFGYLNAASGGYGSAFGNGNTASAYNTSAFGYGNTASGGSSSAFGYRNTASGSYSAAIGYRAKTTVNYTFEAGYWSGAATRSSAIRCHPNGQVAMTIEDSASAPTDGGATAGSEADGTLARGMFAIQKNGTAVTLYYNNAGTIQSLSLGTLS